MPMQNKGIVYDTGTEFTHGVSTRSRFDPDIMKKEIDIIKNDLHCNAIRLGGGDIGRLEETARYALGQGLAVWFSPLLVDASPGDMILYIMRCAGVAEELRRQYPDLVFVIGGEFTFFMKGILRGEDVYSRIRSFVSVPGLLRHLVTGGRWPGKPLNIFLSKVVASVREKFHGRITYASGPWEAVDWRLFDIVSINYYRDEHNEKTFRDRLAGYAVHGKPVAITEFGCCTYEGAEKKGAAGWAIIDNSRGVRTIRGNLVRSEDTQSRYLTELLTVFGEHGVFAAFVFQFAGYNLPVDDDPVSDLDMASYGIVKVLPDGMPGKQYPGMPWEPKVAFRAVADLYREPDTRT
jgi:hypothetical protein